MTIVGVAGRDTAEPMGEFVARHDLPFDNVADVDGDVWAVNGVGGQPAWTFIDGETGEATTQFGALGADGLNAAIDDLTG